MTYFTAKFKAPISREISSIFELHVADEPVDAQTDLCNEVMVREADWADQL